MAIEYPLNRPTYITYTDQEGKLSLPNTIDVPTSEPETPVLPVTGDNGLTAPFIVLPLAGTGLALTFLTKKKLYK